MSYRRDVKPDFFAIAEAVDDRLGGLEYRNLNAVNQMIRHLLAPCSAFESPGKNDSDNIHGTIERTSMFLNCSGKLWSRISPRNRQISQHQQALVFHTPIKARYIALLLEEKDIYISFIRYGQTH